MIYNYEDIRVVHLELTSKCNALCAMCARSIFGAKVNPNLDMDEITLEDFKKIFPVDFIKQLTGFTINGNYGDPALATDLIPIIKYMKEHNEFIVVRIHTNGGVNSPDWWRELASVINNRHCQVHWGIDGLEDTNHLYRLNVKWEKVYENATAFIEAGGTAIWNFIAFKHNQHQVLEAKKLAKEMGFMDFLLKKTGRFLPIDVGGKMVSAHPVHNKDYSFSHFLEPVTNEEYLNASMKGHKEEEDLDNYAQELREQGYKLPFQVERTFEKYNKLEQNEIDERKLYDKSQIECRVKAQRSVFVNYKGQVFPCCWTAWPYEGYWDQYESKEVRHIINNIGGVDKINAKLTPLKEIIESGLFKVIGDGLNPSCSENPLRSCGETCGGGGAKLKDESPVK